MYDYKDQQTLKLILLRDKNLLVWVFKRNKNKMNNSYVTCCSEIQRNAYNRPDA